MGSPSGAPPHLLIGPAGLLMPGCIAHPTLCVVSHGLYGFAGLGD